MELNAFLGLVKSEAKKLGLSEDDLNEKFNETMSEEDKVFATILLNVFDQMVTHKVKQMVPKVSSS